MSADGHPYRDPPAEAEDETEAMILIAGSAAGGEVSGVKKKDWSPLGRLRDWIRVAARVLEPDTPERAANIPLSWLEEALKGSSSGEGRGASTVLSEGEHREMGNCHIARATVEEAKELRVPVGFRFFLPGCWGGAVYGAEHCTCPGVSDARFGRLVRDVEALRGGPSA
jgi:hypothetical protein